MVLLRGGRRIRLDIILIILVVSVFFFVFFFGSMNSISGHAALDLDIDEVGDIIQGRAVFSIREGELVPADSIVRSSLNEQRKEIKLSELVSPNTEGNFYVEGVQISGRGEGYGFIGEKRDYPDVFFTLVVGDGVEGDLTDEEGVVGGVPVIGSSGGVVGGSGGEVGDFDVEGNSSNGSVSGFSADSVQPRLSPPSSSSVGLRLRVYLNSLFKGGLIVGRAIDDSVFQEIEAIASRDRPFRVNIGDKEVFVKKGSVFSEGENIDENFVKLERRGISVIASTDYYIVEERGFGGEFLTDERNNFEIGLENFGIASEKGVLKVELVYDNKIISSFSKDLGDSDSSVPEIVNDRECILTNAYFTMDAAKREFEDVVVSEGEIVYLVVEGTQGCDGDIKYTLIERDFAFDDLVEVKDSRISRGLSVYSWKAARSGGVLEGSEDEVRFKAEVNPEIESENEVIVGEGFELGDELGGRTIYVDKDNVNCDDRAEGTQESPFCSVQPAANFANTPGDTVLIYGASSAYTSPSLNDPVLMQIKYSGEPGNYISFTGVDSGKGYPILNGRSNYETAGNTKVLYIKNSNWINISKLIVSNGSLQGIVTFNSTNIIIQEIISEYNGITGARGGGWNGGIVLDIQDGVNPTVGAKNIFLSKAISRYNNVGVMTHNATDTIIEDVISADNPKDPESLDWGACSHSSVCQSNNAVNGYCAPSRTICQSLNLPGVCSWPEGQQDGRCVYYVEDSVGLNGNKGENLGSSNIILRNNIVYNAGDNGMGVAAPGSTAIGNIVWGSGTSPAGGGDGRGMSARETGPVILEGNIVFDNTFHGFSYSGNNTFRHNLAYGNVKNGISNHAGEMKNNLGANNSLDVSIGDAQNSDVDYNFWADGQFVQGHDQNSLSGDPLLLNPNVEIVTDPDVDIGGIQIELDSIRSQVRARFGLQQGSLAIDAGVFIQGYHCPLADDNGQDPDADCRHWFGDAPDIGPFEFNPSSARRTIYVDNSLSGDCVGNYNIENRDCSGGDGDAFDTLQEAANNVGAGETVEIREGIYVEIGRAVGGGILVNKSGSIDNRILIKNYDGEEPIIDSERQRGCFHIGGTKQQPGGDYVTIEGITCKDLGSSGISVHGAKFVELRDNRIFNEEDWPRNSDTFGISVSGPTEDTLIENNVIYQMQRGIEVRQSGGDYPGQPKNITARYNHVHHMHVTNPTQQNHAFCINAGNGVQDWIVEKNVAHHCDDYGVGQNEMNGSITARDNIVYLNDYVSGGGGGNGVKSKPLTGFGLGSPYHDVVEYNIVFLNKNGGGYHLIKFSDGWGSRSYNNLAVKNYEGYNIGVWNCNEDPASEHISYSKNNFAAYNINRDWPQTCARPVGSFDYNYVRNTNNHFLYPNYSPNTRTGSKDGEPMLANVSLLDVDTDGDQTPDILEPLDDPDAFPDGRSAYEFAYEKTKEMFMPLDGSPLIDGGVVVQGLHCPVSGDIEPEQQRCKMWYGDAPDIGVFEYNGTSSGGMRTIYVDGDLSGDCVGDYNIVRRDCSGSDGDAFDDLRDVTGYNRHSSIYVPSVYDLTAGDRIFIRGGAYDVSDFTDTSTGFTIVANGTVQEPIVIKNYNNEGVVFQSLAIDGRPNKYIFQIKGSNIVLDGLSITRAYDEGIVVENQENVTIKNSKIYENNEVYRITGSGYSAGIKFSGGGNNIIEYSEIFNNGNGVIVAPISGGNTKAQDALEGCVGCVVQHNLIYNNTKSGNFGNSDGIVGQFAHRLVIRNNTIWGNPDGGIDTLGGTANIIEYNLIYDNQVGEGNGEGVKTAVRGGGINVIRYNLILEGNKRGIQLGGVGDISYNNIVVANSEWGVTLDSGGRNNKFFNNLAVNNENYDFVCAARSEEYPTHYLDYNFGVTYFSICNIIKGLNQQENINELRVIDLEGKDFRPASADSALVDNGLNVSELSAVIIGDIQGVIANASLYANNPQKIQESIGFPVGDFRNFQAQYNYQRVVDTLENENTSFYTDLSELKDLDGNIVPLGNSLDIGGYEFTGGGERSCDLNNAYWNTTSAVEGDVVQLIVEGSDCVGEQINFTIWEDDLLIDEFVTSIVDEFDGTTWIAEWMDDGVGDPEYYFDAFVVGNESETERSGLLSVSVSGGGGGNGTRTIYVDNQLDQDCTDGTYDVVPRTCGSGNDGNAYNNIQDVTGYSQANDVWIEGLVSLQPGDNIVVREGLYNYNSGRNDQRAVWLNVNGTTENPITIKNYNGERPVINRTSIQNPEIVLVTADYNVIDGLTFSSIIQSKTGIRIKDSADFVLRNSEIYSVGGTGQVYVGIHVSGYGSTNCLIEYNNIHDNGAGVSLGDTVPNGEFNHPQPSNCEVHHNFIYNNTVTTGDSDGMVLRGVNHYIHNNFLIDNADDGIDIEEALNNTLEANTIVRSGYGPGCTPEAGCNGQGIKNRFGINNTYIGNIVFANKGAGFDMDGNPNPLANKIYNGVAFMNVAPGFNFGGNKDIIIKNNIAFHNEPPNYVDWDNSGGTIRTVSDYNLWGTQQSIQALQQINASNDVNSIVGDPLFLETDIPTLIESIITDVYHPDFGKIPGLGLLEGSPVIDAGMIIPGVHCPFADDNGQDPDADCWHWNGRAPDIGAFEFTGGEPPENRAPSVSDGQETIRENEVKQLRLQGHDPDVSDDLTFEIVSQPRNGRLGIINNQPKTQAFVDYTPNDSFVGEDTFTFKANDGELDSNVGTFRITIEGVGAECGNGVIEEGEQCDGADLRGRDCRVEGHPNGGILGCYPAGHERECTYDFASCSKLPKRDLFDGNTTNFEEITDIRNVPNPVLERTSHGMINFKGTLDFERVNIDSVFNITDKRIEVDTDNYPRFKVSAELRMYDLEFENPRILKNGEVCTDCEILAYNNGIILFNVSTFSIYEVQETPTDREEGDNNDGNNNGGGNNNNGGGTQTTNGPVPGCEVNWDCGGWSECSDGAQARSCVDLSDCGTTYQKPSEVQECGEESSSDDVTRSSFGEWLRNVFGRLRQLPVAVYVSVVGLISAIILFILLSRIFKRRRIANRYVLNKIKQNHV